MKNLYPQILLLSLMSMTMALPVQADLIPTGDNTFYYKIGGGQDIPLPANMGATSIPLNANSDYSLGYNCGAFNPSTSITNSLNNITNSFQNVEQGVLSNATSAVTEFPMYALARADPDLYNLLNNGLLGARRDLELSTKSCQIMQNEIAQGKNPYNDWASASVGNDWKYRMSLASDSSGNMKATASDTDEDINQVNAAIAKDNGNNGVPWVKGTNTGRNGMYAGGVDQPVISVLQDTSVAGYNVILQTKRNYDDTSTPVKTDANAHLVDTWANPELAAQWITTVLGDEKITTYQGGDKQSSPGVGLLPDNQQITTQVSQQLQKIVSGQSPLNLTNLQAVSAPGVMINTAVITAIRQRTPVTQAILINKLAQEVATAKVIDKALLAKQILQEGSQIPAIYSNKAAQDEIHEALTQLQEAMDNLLFNVNVRKQLVSDTVTQLLTSTQNQQLNSTAIQTSNPPNPTMDNGAIHTTGDHAS